MEQFLTINFHGFGRKRQAKFCANVKFLLSFGAFGRRKTLKCLKRFIWFITLKRLAFIWHRAHGLFNGVLLTDMLIIDQGSFVTSIFSFFLNVFCIFCPLGEFFISFHFVIILSNSIYS